MVLSRLAKGQLIGYLVLLLVGTTFAAIRYVELPKLLFGYGVYEVTVDMSDGARLYPGALVTYRGVTIGEVDRLELMPDGVDVHVVLENGWSVPTDVVAEARSISAIGEQYINLAPRTDDGPFLADGDRISRENTTLPIQMSPMLDETAALADSVDAENLRVLVNELFDGFSGAGDEIGSLLDDSSLLLDAAEDNLDPTLRLIENLEPVLATQSDVQAALRSSIRDLASFSEVLRDQDANLRAVLDNGQPFAAEFAQLFDDLNPTLPVLLANLVSTGQVVDAYLDSVRQILVVFPAEVEGAQSSIATLRDDDAIFIHFNGNDDPDIATPCTIGYPDPTEYRRSMHDLEVRMFDLDSWCKASPDDRRVVRGARNAPCPNNPAVRAADPADCGLKFPGPDLGRLEVGAAIATSPWSAFSDAPEESGTQTLLTLLLPTLRP